MYAVLWRRNSQIGLLREWKYYERLHAAQTFAEKLEADSSAQDVVLAEIHPLETQQS